jgi:spore maturation protein CgeB
MTNHNLRILAVSPVSAYGGHNTSIHRIWALQSLGCQVDVLDTTTSAGVGWWRRISYRLCNRMFRSGLPIGLPDLADIDTRLPAAIVKQPYDVLWLERVMSLDPVVLSQLCARYPQMLIVGFCADDMASRHNQSRQFLRSLYLYDLYLTTKTYNVAELEALGCAEARFIGNGFDPATFRPLPVSEQDELRLGGDVGFIGTYEGERAEMLQFLAAEGLSIRVWGNSWRRLRNPHANLRLEYKALHGDDFAKACRAFKINLGFLRKLNRDQQTTRSVEIPACGGFMLAERTDEHLAMFHEGEEAEFFDSRQELLNKCQVYLADSHSRQTVADRGYQRCLRDGYSNEERLAAMVPRILAKLRGKGIRGSK